ncbi:MAG: class I SAM-dependent methyltransferase [Candidatus Hydrogenedentes bacterium]|nr:class I SAM-dependent methyltransferase [Candidatus Hydrogenedentota bacterium]
MAAVKEQIVPPVFGRVLDIGCGTGDLAEWFDGCEYVGFDINPAYIETARRRHGKRGRFFCGSVTDEGLAVEAHFDVITAIGVIHHLSDEEAAQLFCMAARLMKVGGCLITIDPCLVDGQSGAARLLMSMDRGRYVRPIAEYMNLAACAFAEVETDVRHDLIRIPYTHLIMRVSAPRGLR